MPPYFCLILFAQWRMREVAGNSNLFPLSPLAHRGQEQKKSQTTWSFPECPETGGHATKPLLWYSIRLQWATVFSGVYGLRMMIKKQGGGAGWRAIGWAVHGGYRRVCLCPQRTECCIRYIEKEKDIQNAFKNRQTRWEVKSLYGPQHDTARVDQLTTKTNKNLW